MGRVVPVVHGRQHPLFLFFIVMGILMKTCAQIDTKRCIDMERHALLGLLPPGSVNSSNLPDRDCYALSLANQVCYASFIADQDCCNWPGVHCSNETGRIFRLNLAEFLPTSLRFYPGVHQVSLSPLLGLQDLLHLEVIDGDYYCFIFGQIPSIIGSFPKLRYLNLSSALFYGSIPSQLGNLTRLQSLQISSQYDSYYNASLFVDSIKWVSRLTSLKRLVLHNVDLSRATDWIDAINNIPSLTYLDLHETHLPNAAIPSLPLSTNASTLSKTLSFVDLSSNNLTSNSILTWLLNHTSLVHLRLFSNQLEGPIDISDACPCMSSLSYLDLSFNRLEGQIPSGFSCMSSLSYLDLSCNNLTGLIPNGFRSIASLSHLDLSRNQLEGEFSYSIQGLCSLRQLDLSRNKLSGDLSSIIQSLSCSAQSLTVLSLHHNNLTGSLPDVQQLSNVSVHSGVGKPWGLTVLKLQRNQLTGPVPDVSALSLLKVLQLQHNQLYGSVHVSLGQLFRLEKLDISYNSLLGHISASHFTNLSMLLYLDMSFNSITLNVSSNWVPPFKLVVIGLASCNLGPRFPAWLRTQEFGILDMSSAGISDTIPLWFWNLTSLASFICLSHNQLQGTLPNLPISLFSMNPNIDLSSNNLEGEIPSFLANALYLNLSRNTFSGPISLLCPPELDSFISLDLSHNLLSGKLPSCLMNLTMMVLDLSNNNFSGNISLSGNLLSLHLENNRFSGELSLPLGNFSNLLYLDLGGNLISGNIPSWIGHMLPNLITLSLQNNSFSGSIPPQLCQLSSLQILDLSMNNLSGSVPNCLRDLTAMTRIRSTTWVIDDADGIFGSVGQYKDYVSIALKGLVYEYSSTLELVKVMDLSSNKLEGDIPGETSCLTGLVSLNLSRNNLGGCIPSQIGSLASLESLDLSQNHLSGEIPTSISNLNFLAALNLAGNNLSGRIPTGTQIQGFNSSIFQGNPGLCGLPLLNKCPGDGSDKTRGGGEPTSGSEGYSSDERYEHLGLCISIVVGFITGFWGVCGSLVLKRSWRIAYFRLWNHTYDRLYVIVALMFAKR